MASIPERWLRGPKPDPAVLELIDLVREAAATGQIRAIAIITIDPQLNVETSKAGDHDLVRKRLLAAGCLEVSQVVLSPESK